MNNKKVAVIGGGAAGLCAARHCTAQSGVGDGVTVFEQTSQLGGTWVYTQETDSDQFGLPIHSSMYKNLRTNLPKEIMGFPDFELPDLEESYIPGKDVLKFLNDYADHFDLRKYFKLNHLVRKVSPILENKWEIEVTNLLTNNTRAEIFDAVMVCNGHYHTPMYPKIKGMETFSGMQSHSHHYRVPEKFKGKSVVIIGGGPSGFDIALDISSCARKVILSHHLNTEIKTKFPSNVFQKPDVVNITNETIHFTDSSQENVDELLFCTGYYYKFPFLSEECKVSVEDNFVQPLYKHLIHIYYPTMCFIGLPFYVCTFRLFDLQVRVFLKLLRKEIHLPSLEEMLTELEHEIKWRCDKGLKRKHYHMMGEFQGNYYDELSAFGDLPSIPMVYTKLHIESGKRFIDDLVNFRKDVFRIMDENNFVKIK